MKIWKVSHGTSPVSSQENSELLQRRFVTVHKDTKAKGKSNISQGDAYMHKSRVGDVFYLCRGNQRVEILGVFCGDPITDEEGWSERPYEIISVNRKEDERVVTNKWWGPDDNSTFIEVPTSDFKDFEAKILKPFFNISIKQINSELKRLQNNKMCNKLSEILLKNHQIVLTGAPGTGKTQTARAIAARILKVDVLLLDDPFNPHPQFGFVQFHPSYDYSDFVEGLKPVKGESGITFELRPGVFKAFCTLAHEALLEDEKKPDEEIRKFVFVIDEINRADLSRVFGELFFAIEQGYRGKSVTTQYASLSADGGRFSVPRNVFIIGTMNDIDRSVESMDFALRRRFAWKEIPTDEACFIRVMDGVFTDQETDLYNEAKTRYAELNRVITENMEGLGSAYQIGPAYFRKLSIYKQEQETMWSELWNNHLSILLKEYLRGMSGVDKKMETLKNAYETKDV